MKPSDVNEYIGGEPENIPQTMTLEDREAAFFICYEHEVAREIAIFSLIIALAVVV